MSRLRALGAVTALLLVACSSGGDAAPAVCGAVDDHVTPADFVWSPGVAPPEATGGTLAEGDYYLAEQVLYGTDPACEEQIAAVETRSPYARQALRVTPATDTTGLLELVTAVSAEARQSSASYTIVDTTLSFSNVCGAASPFPEGVPFSAGTDEAWFFPPQSTCGPQSLRFTRF